MAVRRVELTAGDVWWARPDPGVGREQAGRRPVVVVSGTHYNDTVETLALVVPISTRDRGWPNHVALRGAHGLSQTSFAMTEQVRCVSRDRLVGEVGPVTPDCLDEIRRWVHDYLVD